MRSTMMFVAALGVASAAQAQITLDGVADNRRSISYGHGVRVGFLGHDLHGLNFGPETW